MRQTKTWKQYKYLLQQYREAHEMMVWKGTYQPEEHPAINERYKKARQKLDAFVMTHLALHAIEKNETIV